MRFPNLGGSWSIHLFEGSNGHVRGVSGATYTPHMTVEALKLLIQMSLIFSILVHRI